MRRRRLCLDATNTEDLDRFDIFRTFVLPLTYPEKGGGPADVGFVFLLPVPYVGLSYSSGPWRYILLDLSVSALAFLACRLLSFLTWRPPSLPLTGCFAYGARDPGCPHSIRHVTTAARGLRTEDALSLAC